MRAPDDTPDVTVTITDNQGNVNKNSVTLNKQGGNQVIWHNSATDTMNIDFPGGSPFPSSQYTVQPGGSTPSGVPNVQANPNRQYAYVVASVRLGVGADPVIIVDN